jgi:hypothetical protein
MPHQIAPKLYTLQQSNQSQSNSRQSSIVQSLGASRSIKNLGASRISLGAIGAQIINSTSVPRLS